MTKTMTIELALQHKPERYSDPIIKDSPYNNRSKYDILTFKVNVIDTDFDYDYANEIHEYFIRGLELSKEKQKMLEMVCFSTFRYLESLGKLDIYNITNSYAYFAFTDELDRTLFSSPYETSPVLFDPNERYGKYSLLSYNDNGIFDPEPNDQPFKNLVKRTDRAILNYETAARRVSNYDNTVFIYNPKAIVNSLFNYYKRDFNELTSIYEEPKKSNVSIGNVFTLSTYELRSFHYVTNKSKH